jgi:nucleosome assembly protein 1-like 1
MNDPQEKEIEQKMVKTILQMPKEIQDRFKVLHMLSDKRSKLNDEFNDACKQIEAKIRDKKKPHLAKRKEIIEGATEFGDLTLRFDDKLAQLEKQVAAIVKTGEEENKEEETTPTDVSYLKGKAGIPDFWLRALKNNKMIWDQVKEKDQEIMEHLKSIDAENSENPETKNDILTLKFEFNAAVSEFMEPASLEVAIEYEDEHTVKEIKATEITWVEGKDPTKKKIKKKQKHKKTGETRTVVKTVDSESFFNIFQNRVAPKEGEEGNDSDEQDEARDKIDQVQQLVEDIHDLLLPEALEYYLGFNQDFDMLGLGDEGEESDYGNESDDGEKKDKKEKK